MSKAQLLRLIRLVNSIQKSGKGRVSPHLNAAVLGLMFGAGWIQEAVAQSLTSQQLVEKLAVKLSSVDKKVLVDAIDAVLTAQAKGIDLSIEAMDKLASQLMPLATEAGITQDQLMALLKDVGFSEIQLAKLRPELDEVVIQERLNTPDAIEAAADGAGGAVGATSEGVLPVAGVGAGGALAGALGLAAAAGGGGGAAAASTPATAPEVVTLNKTISVIDGPLKSAQVFYDSNLDGIAQQSEFLGETDDNGALQVSYTPVQGAKFIIVSDEDTTDTLTGNKFGTLLMLNDSGLDGDQVASPLSTLISSGAISEAALKAALGIDSSIDLLSFNFIDALKGGAANAAALDAAQKLSAAAVAFGNIVESSINAAKALNSTLDSEAINQLTVKAFESAAKALTKIEPGSSLAEISGAVTKFASAAVLDPTFDVDSVLANLQGNLTADTVIDLPAGISSLVNNLASSTMQTSANLTALFESVSDLNSFNAVVGNGGALDDLEDSSEDSLNQQVNEFFGLELNKDEATVLEGQSEVIKGNLLMNDLGLPSGFGLFTVNGAEVPSNIIGPAANTSSVGNSYVLSTTGYTFDGSNLSKAQLANFAGFTSSAIDKAGNAGTAGSAIKQSLVVKAGDVLTFDYKFGSYDYLPYNDFGFFSIKNVSGLGSKDGVFKLVNVQDVKGPQFYADAGVFKTFEATLTYTFTEAGTYTVGVGVTDSIDQIFDSVLTVQNFKLNGSSIGSVAEKAGNVQVNATAPITEVTALVVLGDFGTLVVNKAGDYAYIPGGTHVTDDLVAGQSASDEFTYTIKTADGKIASQKLSIDVIGTGTGVDTPPIANDDMIDVQEDSEVLSGSVALNDFDLTPGVGGLVYTLNSVVPGLVFNSDGTYTFDPSVQAYQSIALGQTLTIQAPYTVSDAAGQTDSALLQIVLTGTNDAPTVVVDNNAASESVGVAVTGNLAANDDDVDQGGTLTYSLNSPVAGLTVDASGAYVFNPSVSQYNSLATGQVQVIVASIAVTDDLGEVTNSTLTITLTGTNDAPIAVADVAAVNENANTLAGTVASNDSDPDAGEGAQLTYSLNNPVAGLTMNSNGTYLLNLAQPGYNSLAQGQTLQINASYTVTDPQGATAIGSLSITITGQNDAPVALNDSNTVNEGTGIVVGNLAANDSDPDQGAKLTYSLSSPVPGLTVNPNGMYSFDTNVAAYNGLTQGQTLTVFAFINVVDDQGKSLETAVSGIELNSPGGNSILSITLFGTNDAPVAVVDTFNAIEDAGTLSGSVALNDSDPDTGEAAQLTYALNNPVAGLVLNPNGTFSLDLTLPQYQQLQQDEDFVINASYTVKDPSGATSTATLTISVVGQNDLPVILNDSISVTEGSSLVIGDLSVNDSDVDSGDSLTYVLNSSLAGLTVQTNGSYSFDPAHPAYDSLAQGQILVLAAPYTVTDSAGAIAQATLTLTLTGTNDAPVAVADTNVAPEGAAVIVGSVAVNDIDVDAGSILTFSIANTVDGLTFNPDGSYLFDPNNPAYDNVVGTLKVVIPYTVTDNFGATSASTLTISVLAGNDLPIALADSNSASEDAELVTGSVAVNDSDPDGDVLTYSLVEGFDGLVLNEDGSYQFNPSNSAYQSLAAGESIVLVATYQVQDSSGSSDISTLTISLLGTNDSPVATVVQEQAQEDGAVISGSLLAAVQDADAQDTLTFNLLTPIQGLMVFENGDFEFDASGPVYQNLSEGAVKTIVANYSVTDQLGATSISTLTLMVVGTNDAPVAFTDFNSTSVFDGVVSGSVALNDFDVDQDSVLTYTLSENYPGLVLSPNGEYVFDSHGAQIALDENGIPLPLVFEYVVTDQFGASSQSSLIINILLEENSPPVAQNDTLDVAEGTGFFFGNLAENDSDADEADTLSYSLLNQIKGLSVFSDGSYQFNTFDAAYNGLSLGESLILNALIGVTDSKGAQSISTLSISLLGTNDVPVVQVDTNTATESVSVITGDVSANDFDLDASDELTYSLVGSTPAGLLFSTDGTYVFDATVPEYNYLSVGQSQQVLVTYEVTDNAGATAQSVLQITVIGTNDAPVAFEDSVGISELPNSPAGVSGNLLINDEDVDQSDILNVVQINGQSANFQGTNDFVLSTNSSVNGGIVDNFGGNSQASIEAALNLPSGTLDMVMGTQTNGQIPIDATIGSVIYKQVTVQAGQMLVFDYSFGSLDYLPFNDFGFVSIEGAGVFKLNNVEGIKGPLTGTLSGVFVQSLKETFSYVFTEAGTYTVALGVMNVGDTSVDSKLIVDGLNVPGPFESLGIVEANADLNNGNQAVFVEGDYGFLTVFPNGQYQYTLSGNSLAEGVVANEVFNYTVADQSGSSSFSKLTIQVTGTNDAPLALVDTNSVTEGTGIQTGTVAANDIDVDDGAQLSFTALTQLAGFVLAPDGGYMFDSGNSAYDYLQVGQSQTFSVTYQVQDELGATSVNSLGITVTGSNDLPVAVIDSNDVQDVDSGVSIVSGNLLFNDSDPDSFSLKVVSAGGQQLEQQKPTNEYLLSTNYSSYGSFSGPASQSNIEGALGIAAGSLDQVAGTSFFSNSQSGINATVGSVIYKTVDVQAGETLSFDFAFGSIDYLPYNDFAFVAIEGVGVMKLSNVTAIKGPVFFNKAYQYVESAVQQFSYQFAEAGSFKIAIGVMNALDGIVDSKLILKNFNVETDFTTLGIVDVTGEGGTLSAQSFVTIEGDYGLLTVYENGQYSYTLTDDTLPEGFIGQENFSYTVADPQGGSSVSSLIVNVKGGNDNPVSVDDENAAVEGTEIISGSVAANDRDVDQNAQLQFELLNQVDGLTFNTDGTYSFDPTSSTYDYLKNGETLQLFVSYSVTDEFDATSFGTLVISLIGTNDAPVAQAQVLQLVEAGDASAVLVGGNVFSSGLIDPDSNDTVKVLSVESQVLVPQSAGQGFLLSTNYPAGGFSANAVGQFSIENTLGLNLGVLDSVLGTAPPGYGSSVDATVGSAIYKVITVNAGDSLSFDYSFGSVDYLPYNDFAFFSVEGIGVTKLSTVQDIKGPVFYNQAGTYVESTTQQFNFTFTQGGTYTIGVGVMNAYDGVVDSKLSVNNISINNTPVSDFLQTGIVESQESADLSQGQATIEGLYGSLTIFENGEYSYSLKDQSLSEGQTAQEVFDYVIADSFGATSSSTIKINLVGTNDGPIAVEDFNAAVEGGTTIFGSVAANDRDLDQGDQLTYTLFNEVNGLTLNPDGTYTFDPTGPEFDYLAVGQSQEIFVPYSVTDLEGASASSALKITVTGTNDAPTAVVDVVSAIEDTSQVFEISQLLANDFDVDSGDTFTFESVGNAVNGTVVYDQQAGTVTFTPNFNFFGEAFFDYSIKDSNGAVSTATVTVQVADVEDQGELTPDEASVIEDIQPLTFGNVLSNDVLVAGVKIKVGDTILEPANFNQVLLSTGSDLANINDEDPVNDALASQFLQSIFSLEFVAGLQPGDLNNLVTFDGSGGVPSSQSFEGSAIGSSFFAGAGQTFSFDYQLVSAEVDVNDFAYVTIVGPNGFKLVQVLDQSANLPNFIGNAPEDQVLTYVRGEQGTFEFVFQEEGEYTVSIGVVDTSDQYVASQLLVNNLNAPGAFTPYGAVVSNAVAVDELAQIKGQYGVLYLQPDGGYLYILANEFADVNALNDGETLTDLFFYEVIAPDGTVKGSTLSVTINGTTDLQFVISEQQASELIDQGFVYAPNDSVNLQVDGVTVSDKGLTLAGVTALGVDVIKGADDGAGDIDIELGLIDPEQALFPTFDTDGQVTVGLGGESEGTTLASNKTALAGLASLGVDSVALTDGGNFLLGEAGAVTLLEVGLTIADDFTSANENGEEQTLATNAVLFADGTTLADKGLSLVALQALGIDTVVASSMGNAQLNVELGDGFTLAAVQEDGVEFFSTSDVTLGLSAAATEFGNSSKLSALAALGIDQLALADGGTLGVSVAEAINVQNADLVFADDFVNAIGSADDTNLTSVVLNADGTSLADTPLTLKALAALGVDVLQGQAGETLSVDVGASSISEFAGSSIPTFAENVLGNVQVDDDFIASFDSNEAAAEFFDALGAESGTIKVGDSAADLSTILSKLENINDGTTAFDDLKTDDLVQALDDAGIRELVYDTDNPITDMGTERLEALAAAGKLRAETDKTLAELGDLDANEAAAEVDTLGIDGVKMTVKAGIEFTGDDAADAAALDELLNKFDADNSDAVEAGEALFVENAKITLAVDTSDMSLTGDQLQDLINLGVDSLVNQDGTTVDIIGKTGDQTDIFGNNN